MVRVPDPEGFRLRPGERGALGCWGFLPNGRLRHPIWLGWAAKTPEPTAVRVVRGRDDDDAPHFGGGEVGQTPTPIVSGSLTGRI